MTLTTSTTKSASGPTVASVRIHGEERGNTLFVASRRSDLALLKPPDLTQVHSSCVASVKEAFGTLKEPSSASGRVLTDDYNPVEFYDAGNRERLRRGLAMAMQPKP